MIGSKSARAKMASSGTLSEECVYAFDGSGELEGLSLYFLSQTSIAMQSAAGLQGVFFFLILENG